jgi:glycosyltransferase involved in cell wall biosynthesis
MYKKISIVTPSFNQGRYLEQTILSVINQGYPNLEYIIIDGGSSDNSLEIIRKYEKHLKYWVCEPDLGQADAINKGLKYCTGVIFNWLNSDDYLENNSLFVLNKYFEQNIDVVAGRVRVFNLNESRVSQNKNLSSGNLLLWKMGVDFIQPGVWMRLDNLFLTGSLSINLHYSFDWEYYIKYLSKFNRVLVINDVLVHFRLHDESKTQTSFVKFQEEEKQIVKNILIDNNFKSIHKYCKLRIKKGEFFDVNQRNISAEYGKVKKCVIFFESFFKFWPASFSRMSLAFLKNILFRAN